MEGLMSPVDDKLRSLSLVDIFEPLSTEEIERLNEQLSGVHLERDEIFYTPDDPNEKLFALQTGRVRIYKVVDDRELTLDVVEAGTVFGEMALTAQRLRGTYAQALEPSEISVLSRDQLEHITLRDVLARLASLILSLVDREAVVTRWNLLKIPNHYTHEQLGTMIGAKRESVTRAFARLQDERAVELKRRLIYVTNVQALRRLARFTGHRDDGEEQTP